ncbi:MAG TPA: hemerythrin domain-containing protein [Allosphingosinicella sp.]|jgi:hemerythrin superfamily protein
MADAKIYAHLKADHDRHRDLIARIEDTSRKDEERRALFEEFRKELQAHAAAEEEALYAVMLANPELRDEARHSVSEHKEVDDLLGELVEKDTSSLFWMGKFKTMRDRYLHHIEEEEEEMFPAASNELSAEKEAEIAAVFERRKPKELERAETELPGDARE